MHLAQHGLSQSGIDEHHLRLVAKYFVVRPVSMITGTKSCANRRRTASIASRSFRAVPAVMTTPCSGRLASMDLTVSVGERLHRFNDRLSSAIVKYADVFLRRFTLAQITDLVVGRPSSSLPLPLQQEEISLGHRMYPSRYDQSGKSIADDRFGVSDHAGDQLRLG